MSATRRDAVWAAAVVGNGGNVTNEGNLETGGVDRAHGGFTTGTRSLHVDTHSAHAVVLSLAGGLFGSNLRGKGRGLTGTLEPALSGTRPAHGVSASIGKSDDSIIERGLDVSHTKGHVLLFSFLGNAFWSSHDLLP